MSNSFLYPESRYGAASGSSSSPGPSDPSKLQSNMPFSTPSRAPSRAHSSGSSEWTSQMPSSSTAGIGLGLPPTATLFRNAPMPTEGSLAAEIASLQKRPKSRSLNKSKTRFVTAAADWILVRQHTLYGPRIIGVAADSSTQSKVQSYEQSFMDVGWEGQSQKFSYALPQDRDIVHIQKERLLILDGHVAWNGSEAEWAVKKALDYEQLRTDPQKPPSWWKYLCC